MFYDDSYAGEMVGISLEDLEKKESAKLSTALTQLDDRLYSEISEPTKSGQHPKKQQAIREYYSEGYNANYDGVEDKEVREWQQSSFSYLRVTGKKSSYCDDIASVTRADSFGKISTDVIIPDSQFIEPVNIMPPTSDHVKNDLVIVGQRINILQKPVVTEEEDEEILAIHGTLIETIEYSALRSNITGSEINQEQEPEILIKEEVLATMLDAIWPDVVTALRCKHVFVIAGWQP